MSDAVTRFVRAAVGPDPGTASDADLLRRFADRRDADAFELLVHRHAGMVRATCRAILRDDHLAEDAAQASFLVLARRAGRVRDNPAGWLYRTARHLALRMRRRAVGPAVPDGLPPTVRHSRTYDADELAILHAELAALPDRDRLPLLLCHLEGLSHADAAARLGWPVGTLSGRLSRARDKLRGRLVRRGLAPAIGTVAGGHAGFAAATARAAVAFAAGQPAGVSPAVLPLVHGAMRAMTIAKLKLVAGLVAAAGVLTAGGVWATAQQPGAGAPGGRAGAEQPPAAAAAPPPRVERLNVDPKAPNPGRPEDPKRTADYAERYRDQNSLKQIGLALHNYESAHGVFPGDITDKATGKPLLSWRVAILPFVEQEALWRRFKLDEPWDSPANKPLLDIVPQVYRLAFEQKPGAVTGPTTYVQGFAGADCLFQPGRRWRMDDIRDGTSNSLFVAQVGPAVPWTKPQDVAYDPAKPFPAVTWPYANVVTVAAGDGAVRQLGPDTPEVRLRALVELTDGRFPSTAFDGLRPEFPNEAADQRAMAGRFLAENQALLERVTGLLKEHGELMAAEPQVGNPAWQEGIRTQLKQLADQLATRNERLKGRPAKK